MTSRRGDGLDAWCYDKLMPRVWHGEGDTAVALNGALELTWCEFDANPAWHALRIHASQRIESFLASGPALATRPSSLSDDIAAYLRATRKPGTTTHVEVIARARDGALLGELHWSVNGAFPEALSPALPGPASCSVVSHVTADRYRRAWRALVAPGPVVVRGQLTYRVGDALLTHTIDAQLALGPGQRHELALDVP